MNKWKWLHVVLCNARSSFSNQVQPPTTISVKSRSPSNTLTTSAPANAAQELGLKTGHHPPQRLRLLLRVQDADGASLLGEPLPDRGVLGHDPEAVFRLAVVAVVRVAPAIAVADDIHVVAVLARARLEVLLNLCAEGGGLVSNVPLDS